MGLTYLPCVSYLPDALTATKMLSIAQMQSRPLPALPEGPTLDSVRAPVETFSFSITQILVAAAIGAVLGGLMAWLFSRYRHREPKPIDPLKRAFTELEAAKQNTDDGSFAQACGDSVRQFLEAKYKLPVTRQTTSELSRELALSPENKLPVVNFLEFCDTIKFAGQALDPEKRIELSDTAKHIITEIGKEPSPT